MRCIECEEIELARVRDVLPSQTMPVPNAALEGFPSGRSPADLTRRRLLQFGVAGFASVYGPKALGWESVWESVAAEAESAAGNCLLLLYLAGGNDGVNTIVPANGADYAQYALNRPVIHRGQGPTTTTGTDPRVGSMPLAGSAGQVLAFSNPLVSTPGGGDNGDANFGLDKLYGDGTGGPGSDLAILPAVDATKYTFSHFDNSDIWFTGVDSGKSATGWLGRWIDRNGSATNPLQAVSIDTAISKAIRTAKNPVCAINTLPLPGFTMGGSYQSPSGQPGQVDANALVQTLAGVPTGAANAYLARTRSTYGVSVETYQKSKLVGAAPANPDYPSTATLSNRLRMAAQLFAANIGTRIITIHWGGFDTHGNQLATQDPQLKELSRALGAFKKDLATRGIEQQVTTLIFSEFGRRAAENASGGTDHGAGGLMMLSGSSVYGGLASQWPGTETKELVGGNLAVPTDYRSVYSNVISEWLQDDPLAVLGGTAPTALVRGDGANGHRLFK